MRCNGSNWRTVSPYTQDNESIAYQGAYLQWNRDGANGTTYLINQRGGGSGGISFGEATTGNAYTQNVLMGADGSFYIRGQGYKPGGGSWADSSDRRLKKNIVPLTGGLAKITALNPVSFAWINPTEHGGKTHMMGFIAQEVEEVFPDFVGTQKAKGKDAALVGPDGTNKTLELPIGFDAQLVSAIKELKAENEALRRDFENYRSKHP